jgi:hypothetical protein
MNKLSDIDKNYRTISAYMTVKEKIAYCANIIYRTHLYLRRNSDQLSRLARNKTREILTGASNELAELSETRNYQKHSI